MHPTAARYAEQIRAIAPDVELENATVNEEGLVNDVLMVGERVFRFARTAAGVRDLQTELEILDRIRPRVSVAVPMPFHRSANAMAYRRLPGVTLRNVWLRALPEPAQQRLADQLAEALFAIHTTPGDGLPPTGAPTTAHAQEAIRRDVEALVYPLLMRHQREWAEALFDSMLSDPAGFDHEPVLIHGDIGPYHLLVDEDSASLTGILDFGVGGLGDPANDIALLLQNYGESFVARLRSHYPGLERLLNRARYYAQAIELQWAMRGLKSGDAFWFTAHLGAARDMG